MRYAACIIALAAMSACNQNDFVPSTPPGSIIPSIGGTYSSQSMYRFQLSSPSQERTFTCAGSLTIERQVGTTFTGSFLIRDASCNASGTVSNGALGAGGAISFELTAPDSTDPNFLTAAFGCAYVSGDRVMTGTLSGNQLTVEARTAMDCAANGVMTLHLLVSGSRPSPHTVSSR